MTETFIGDPLTGNAIDVTGTGAAVLWIERCDSEAGSNGIVHENFVRWTEEVLEVPG